MTNQFTPHVVPFIPNLEGVYKHRFYALVSSWTQREKQDEYVTQVEKEIDSIEKSEQIKTDQYNRYRAILLLLRDLLTTTWAAHFEYGQLVLNTFDTSNVYDADSTELIQEAKLKLQRCMESSRLRILEENRDFITKIEAGEWPKQKRPISDLITDGKELAKKLNDVLLGKVDIYEVVNPEIQLVDSSIDEYTGLRLLDIWRYFRYTWSSPAENTPGRSMQYLIRNKALPGKPIMGISSLDNCALALAPRDDFLGWTANIFIKKMKELGYSPERILKKIDSYLSDGISSINIDGFGLTSKLLKNPTSEIILELRSSAQREKDERRISLLDEKFKANSDESKKLLFTKKRKEKLANLLEARRHINEMVATKGGVKQFTFDDFASIYSSITVALLSQKEKHIGTSLLELNVCGAIKPYNELLVGKLVALSALTPYVIKTYYKRYKDRPSEIATQMLGEDVIRKPDLVYVGTTSLYSVGSSQYNRLVVPKESIGSSFDLRFTELNARTQGFGTFHISRKTTEAMELVLEKIGSYSVNHQFGEGASPKLRLLGEGVRALLRSDGNNSVTVFTSHAMPRIIYVAPLVSNLSEYLLNIDSKPAFYFSQKDADIETQKIFDFWINRWLKKRLQYAPALERVKRFDLKNEENRKLVGILLNDNAEQEETVVSNVDESPVRESVKSDRIKFLRKFYKNGSAFADSTSLDDLKLIHVKTGLDDAILNTIKSGKDCVLTGNPGDGKTHIIKILENKIRKINSKIDPVYDASTLTTEEILNKWRQAQKDNVPFLIAINASVLYELAHIKSSNLPKVILEAYEQFEAGIVCGTPLDVSNHQVTVFNLGLRSALEPDVVLGVIKQMTDDNNFRDCANCVFKENCGFRRHATLIKTQLFKERILKIFHRIELVGWHITVRDVQSFFSYLLFWNHSCKNVVHESESDQYRIENLIYKEGRGSLFQAIREVFDPAKIALPEIDEHLLLGDYQSEKWLPDAMESKSAIGVSLDEFNRRKRAFYFFHEDGKRLLESSRRSSITEFEKFLSLDERKQLKEILSRIRSFIGARTSEALDSFPIWRGFRFDNSPRKVILSAGQILRSDFVIIKPKILANAGMGIPFFATYVLLKEKKTGKSLRIDFAMFKLLEYSEQKVPVWALEEDKSAKKIWRFMEDLIPNSLDDYEQKVALYDLKRKEHIEVEIDVDDLLYVKITGKDVR